MGAAQCLAYTLPSTGIAKDGESSSSRRKQLGHGLDRGRSAQAAQHLCRGGPRFRAGLPTGQDEVGDVGGALVGVGHAQRAPHRPLPRHNLPEQHAKRVAAAGGAAGMQAQTWAAGEKRQLEEQFWPSLGVLRAGRHAAGAHMSTALVQLRPPASTSGAVLQVTGGQGQAVVTLEGLASSKPTHV